jgi:hypothetical protein
MRDYAVERSRGTYQTLLPEAESLCSTFLRVGQTYLTPSTICTSMLGVARVTSALQYMDIASSLCRAQHCPMQLMLLVEA